MVEMAKYGNIASRSDLEVGAKSLETGIWGAYRNVLINLPTIEEKDFTREVLAESEALVRRAEEKFREVCAVLDGRETS